MWNPQISRADSIYFKKNLCISGPAQFKPMLFKGQLYIHSGKGKIRETVKRSLVSRGSKEGKNRWIGRTQENETILYDTIIVAIRHETFGRTHRR